MRTKDIGSGVVLFEPETDPVKIRQAAEEFDQFYDHVKRIGAALDRHGWDSVQCRIERSKMDEWQQRKRGEAAS